MESRKEDGDRIEPEILDDGTEAANVFDEEVEELHNSLKEVVQDPAVKPKFQCLMVDPSFSMVTVQSEDSGIVWETASSRCSTPWASEASSPSDSFSLEGSGTQGNIVIIMDEDKVRRRKKTRGKLGDRFRRPGSRLSGSAVGEERPAMIEVSLPNIRRDNTEDGNTADGKPDKDQELFNLISEGFEILNIVVPSKLPTVDEECSTELADNLSYLEDTPKIKTKCKHQSRASAAIPEVIDIDLQEIKDDRQSGLSQTPANEQLKKDETDMDYLEKFTLLDQHAPDGESRKPESTQDQEEQQIPAEEQKTEDTVDESSFVIVTEVEIAEDHLDEVFYGASCDAEPEFPSHHKEDKEHAIGSAKKLKEHGSALFESQDTILMPIFLPPGPPKIIAQDLLDEPRAMSFHYSDLYEDATGDRKRDDDASDVESVISEKSFKRRFSDSDDGDGYLEKFILKDDTPVVEDVHAVDTPESDRVIWTQNKFEMTGYLMRAQGDPQEEDVGANQAGTESKDVIEEGCQPSNSSQDCEGCDGLKTGCMTVKCGTLEGCEDCDMETGCTIQQMVSSDKLSSDQMTLMEDGTQMQVRERKHMETRGSGGSVIIAVTDLHDKPEVLQKQPAHIDEQKANDSIAELQEPTREGASDQVLTTTQETGKPNLMKDTSIHVKDTLATLTAEETETVCQKQISELKKCKDLTEQSGEKSTVPEQVPKAELESKPEVLKGPMIPNVVKGLNEALVQSILPESDRKHKTEGHYDSDALDSDVKADLKTISDQENSEKLLVNKEKVSEQLLVNKEKVAEELPVNEEKVSEEACVNKEKVSEEVCVNEAKVLEEIPVTEEKVLEELLVSEAKVLEVLPVNKTKVSEELPVNEAKIFEELPVQEEKVLEELSVKEEKVLEELSVKEEKVSEKLPVKEKKVSEELPVNKDKISEELTVKEGKISEELPVKEEKVSEELPVKEEKVPEELHVKEEKVPEELPVKEEKVSEELPVKEEKVPEELPIKEENVSEELPVKEEKVSEELTVKEEKVPEELPVKEEKVPEELTVKEEKVPEELTVKEEKVPEELTVKEGKISEELPVKEEKFSEELPVNKEKVEELKDETPEKLKEPTEKDTVPVIDRKITDHATRESIKTADLLVESPNNLAKPDKFGEVEKKSGNDQFFETSGESKEAESNAITLTQEIPVACASVPDTTERYLAAALVDGEVSKEGNLELTDACVLNDSHAEMISPIPAAQTDDSCHVIVPPPVRKEEDGEIRMAVPDRRNLETTVEALKPVHPVAVEGGVGGSEVKQVVKGKSESKSKKILLKDTHKEELWRTLESASPSPPMEIEDTTFRDSPLEEIKENLAPELNLKTDKGFSALRSFSPLEDLSGFCQDLPEVQKEMHEELDYEMLTERDARHSSTEVELGIEYQEPIQGQSPELIPEADYEFIEDDTQISEIRQQKENIEIQPADAFCLICRCSILVSDGGHENHEVSTLDKAFEGIKDQLSNWISVLQERSENIEDLVSELELAYNSVEDHCKDGEKVLDEQNEETLKLVMERYTEMSQTMEEEKKAKLEQLYDQIVSFQENNDAAKEAMELTTKEMEETEELAFLLSYKDIEMRLKTALDSAMSVELGPRGLLVFEDYAKGTTGNEKKNRQVIPVPQQPHLQPQEANSATSTSVTVYWTVNEGDIIDCFQVYCMEEPQGAISEEYRVTVKESHCNLEDLEPDKCYKVWVMAVNYTGCSLPSERLPFRTAPSVPVINPEACTVLWDSATIRWSSSQPSAAESFTLEYCRQYALEGEGLRSVSGIKGFQHKVLLQPNENFLFYIKSVNRAGASDQSEAALISTRGTRFHLLSKTANMVLEVSEDKNSVQYPVESYNQMATLIECPAVRGEILPHVGYHYWETVVADCKAYRIGVAYQTEPQDSTVGDSSASWCLHCVPTSISCRFELLHDNVESDIFVTNVPARIGTLLDFVQGRLVFFNALNGQCLGSFQQAFSQPCYPVLTLERPGNLELKMTTEVPEFAKHW